MKHLSEKQRRRQIKLSKSRFVKGLKRKARRKMLNLNDNSWLLLRLSGTEPVVRIYCESKNEKSVNDLISNFIKYIKV